MSRLAYAIGAFIALAVAYLLWKPLLDRQPVTPAITPALATSKAIYAIQLNRTMPEINFTGEELSEVFDFLRDISGCNIFVDWRAIEAAGVKKNTPIHVRIKGMSFSQGVNLVLSHAGKPSTPLLFRIDDLGSGYEVTTQAQLDHGVNLRTHNVASLLRQEEAPFKLAFGYSPFHQSATVPEQRFANIQERIRSRYGKESVLDNEVFLNREGQPHVGWDLIVPQTKEQHEEIDNELAYLAWIPRRRPSHCAQEQ